MNVMGMWKKHIWAQIGYRTNKSIIYGLSFNYKGFDFGYAFQMNNNVISEVSNGTHELQLMYSFGDLLKKHLGNSLL